MLSSPLGRALFVHRTTFEHGHRDGLHETLAPLRRGQGRASLPRFFLGAENSLTSYQRLL